MLVVSVAWPIAFSAPVPRDAGPLKKVTVPIGAPEPGETTATVAVSVTGWWCATVLAGAVTLIVVAALATVTVNADDVLVAKLGSPA